MNTSELSSVERGKSESPSVPPNAANGMGRPEYIFGLPRASRPMKTDAEVTPQIAEALLNMRPQHQRPIRNSRVGWFRELIKSGEFVYTHQGLGFDVNGHLIDGQHRLTALVLEGATVTMQATFGLPVESFAAMDRGATRSVADDLITDGQVENGGHANTVSAAAKVLWMMDRGIRIISTKGYGVWTFQKASASMARHPNLMEAARVAQALPRGVPKGPFAAVWSLFAEKDIDLAEEFVAKMTTGENLHRQHPVYLLREWCIKGARRTNKNKADDFVFRSINAWNAMRQKRSLTVLRGAIGESPSYPKIV